MQCLQPGHIEEDWPKERARRRGGLQENTSRDNQKIIHQKKHREPKLTRDVRGVTVVRWPNTN